MKRGMIIPRLAPIVPRSDGDTIRDLLIDCRENIHEINSLEFNEGTQTFRSDIFIDKMANVFISISKCFKRINREPDEVNIVPLQIYLRIDSRIEDYPDIVETGYIKGMIDKIDNVEINTESLYQSLNKIYTSLCGLGYDKLLCMANVRVSNKKLYEKCIEKIKY